MRIYLAGIILFGTLAAGCSSEWDPGRDGTGKTSAGSTEPDATLPAATLASRGEPMGFASLPDRGELLNYSADRKIRRRGAYTSHPVEISEAHALNAIASGSLQFNTPDGAPVNVAFDRIEEHPDGNWTWVGRNESGERAVLTFGERAVFGEIVAAGQSFRVTMMDGDAWVVETDPLLLAGNHPGPHGDGPGFLIPPSATDLGPALAGATATPAATAGVPTKASPAVIDLLLGYTNGMVTTYRSESAAVSRLTSLVALGNDALQRSGVNMRVRLVRAVQVNFPDNTANTDALQKLTGYNATTRQFTTPDAAFNALRAARDEFGADLVSLVRPHRSPEQRGCGIAWLIGANMSPIVPARDEAFGYSVVSEGVDEDEGDGYTYDCSQYSLIHELGHNMGQAHNEANSDDDGAHAYSYGYRETSTSGFHTIMAYPLANSSQTEIGYFANPAINFAAGRPTGVANESDNVRSMNQTMPMIAEFRATVVPLGAVRFDIDGDGKSDILWWNNVTRQFSFTVSKGTSIGASRTFNFSPGWTVPAVGDFDGDGKADLLSVNASTREYQVGKSTGTAFEWARVGYHSPGWEILGAADINGDGRDDVLWWKNSTRQFSYTLMNGSKSGTSQTFTYSAGWRVAAAGDFDGDGRADLISINTSTREYQFGRSVGTGFQWSRIGFHSAGWQIIGAGDLNGDGRADILWWHPGNRQFSYTLMNGRTPGSSRTFNYSNGWGVNATGDFDGDGRLDLISANNGLGRYELGRTNSNLAFTWSVLGTYGTNWQLLRMW